MAVDYDLVDDIAANVTAIYAEAETALVRLTSRQINDGLARQRLADVRALRQAAQAIVTRLLADTGTAIRTALAAAYRHGWSSALADLPNAVTAEAAREAATRRSGGGFVEALATALIRDFGHVAGNILRDVVDAYRQVQAAAAARVLTGAQTRRQAAQAAWSGLIERGISSFTDRSGRRWALSSYVEMATRTVTARAATQGQVDRLDTLGVDLVYVSDHPQECARCRPYEGKVLRTNAGPTGEIRMEHATRDGVMVTVDVVDTLDGARLQGFQHPNCRHAVNGFLPGMSRLPTNTEDPEGDKARQRQRTLERAIRKAKLQAQGALTPEAKKAANRKIRAAQKTLREHLAANPSLKRLPYREQIGAGNKPPRGQNDPAGGLGPDAPPAPGDAGPQDQPGPPGPDPQDVPDFPHLQATEILTEVDRRTAIGTAAARATAAIDRVHVLPPHMPRLPLAVEDHPQAAGRFHHKPTERKLSLNPNGPHPILTAVHELGHALDNLGLTEDGLSYEAENEIYPGGKFYAWWQAVEASTPFRLLSALYNLAEGTLLVTRRTPGGRTRTLELRHKDLNYLLSPREVFGRTYAQWIATRSQDLALLAELRYAQDILKGDEVLTSLNGIVGYPQFWDDEEFESIASALDEAFSRLGLLR